MPSGTRQFRPTAKETVEQRRKAQRNPSGGNSPTSTSQRSLTGQAGVESGQRRTLPQRKEGQQRQRKASDVNSHAAAPVSGQASRDDEGTNASQQERPSNESPRQAVSEGRTQVTKEADTRDGPPESANDQLMNENTRHTSAGSGRPRRKAERRNESRDEGPKEEAERHNLYIARASKRQR